MRTVGDPVTWTGLASGAEVKAALWPGMSMVSPAGPSGPTPGQDGDRRRARRPAGLTTACGGPASRTRRAAGAVQAGVTAAVATAERRLAGGGVEPEQPGHREARLAACSLRWRGRVRAGRQPAVRTRRRSGRRPGRSPGCRRHGRPRTRPCPPARRCGAAPGSWRRPGRARTASRARPGSAAWGPPSGRRRSPGWTQQRRDGLRAWPAGRGDLLVDGADLGQEAAAQADGARPLPRGPAARDALGEQQARPLPLEHARHAGPPPARVGEQRGGQVVPGALGDDGVDPVVVGGGEQRDPAAVGGAGDADPRVARDGRAGPAAGAASQVTSCSTSLTS